MGLMHPYISYGSVFLIYIFFRYMILSNEGDRRHTRIGKSIHTENRKYIFEKVGIMLHGKHNFCTKFAKICKVSIVSVRA